MEKLIIRNQLDLENEMCRHNCKTKEELEDLLWYNHGILLEIGYKEKPKIQNAPYERTWCDYLTPCRRIGATIEVGSYECERCKFFCGKEKENIPKTEKNPKLDSYYARYTAVITGMVKCKYNTL